MEHKDWFDFIPINTHLEHIYACIMHTMSAFDWTAKWR